MAVRAGEGRLVQVSQYDHAGIDAAGRLTEVRGRVVLRAEQGGLDRWRVPWDLSTGVAPEVVADRNCRVGRIEHDLERDELTTELVLEAAPEPGESVILEYRALFDRPVGSFVRVLAQPVRDYLLEARFAAVPSLCVRVPGEPRPLVADSGGAVHLVAADLTGRIGIRWEQ